MKIITQYPVKVERTSGACGCSGIDGSNGSSVREFQVWANMYHSAQLAPDGVYGPLTKSAYNKWGAEWEKTQPQNTPQKAGGSTVSPGTVTANRDGVNVYSIYDSKILKTAKKGEYVGAFKGEKGMDAIYVTTTMGNAWVTRALVNIAGTTKTKNSEDTPMNQGVAEFVKQEKEKEVLESKKTLIDKWKALSLPAKMGIGLGGLVVLGGIIWILIPKKK